MSYEKSFDLSSLIFQVYQHVGNLYCECFLEGLQVSIRKKSFDLEHILSRYYENAECVEI